MKRALLSLALGVPLAAAAMAQHAHPPAAAAPAGPQPASLDAQLAKVRAGIARYADFAVARREGWRKFGGDGPLVGEHYYLPVARGGVDYRFGQPLDFARPSSLMYTDIAGNKVLTGVTFNVRLAPGEPVPPGFAGASDVWHVHDFGTLFDTALRDRPLARHLAKRTIDRRWGGRNRVAMIHVWAGGLANPDGVFAHYNRLVPYLKLGLAPALAEGASLASARGLNLATADGCKVQIDGAANLAGVPRDTVAGLHRACASAVAHVRQGLASGDKASVNAMAEHGWAMFDSAWNRALTAEQKARIAAVTEHDHPVPVQGAATAHDHH